MVVFCDDGIENVTNLISLNKKKIIHGTQQIQLLNLYLIFPVISYR